MASSSNLKQQLAELRPQLLRFARYRIKDEAMAEDLVQESLLAVLEKPDRFSGKSALSTYVIAILKFKIIDVFRSNAPSTMPPATVTDTDFFDAISYKTDQQKSEDTRYGISQSSLCAEFDPVVALEQKKFFSDLEQALTQLSPRNARVFVMWDWMEMESHEICEELGMSNNNLQVSVHRARQSLRNMVSMSANAMHCQSLRLS